MKNVTLSIPDDLLERSRNYAREHQTTLNEMVRSLLKKTISQNRKGFKEKLEALEEDMYVDTTAKISREELYER